MIADLYGEVLGVVAQARFSAVRSRFMAELKDLRGKDSAHNSSGIIALLIGMKFFRVKVRKKYILKAGDKI